MPTTTTKFCTVTEVHAALGQYSGYNSDDSLIQTQIELATQLIRDHTRRDWERGIYVNFFSTQDIDVLINQGRGHAKFYLAERNVSTADGEQPVVVFNTAGRFEDTEALQYNIDYYVDTRVNAIIMYPGKMVYTGRSLRVAYTAGYPINGTDNSLCEVPTSLHMACITQAAFMTQRILNATTGQSSKTNKAGSATYSVGSQSGLVAEAAALLRSSSRILIGSNA